MEQQPIHPGTIAWSGENPGIYLRESENGPWTCLVSYFRVVISPHGPGHAAIVLLAPGGLGAPGENACYTDNPALARYLIDEFVSSFGPFRDDPNLQSMPLVAAERFTRSGDHRSSCTEHIQGRGVDVRLTWRELREPFLVHYDLSRSATGRHAMVSVFVPADAADVIVNGRRGRGRPSPRDVAGHPSSTAFLAFAETWLSPPRG